MHPTVLGPTTFNITSQAMLPILVSLHQHTPCAALVCSASSSSKAFLVSQAANPVYQPPITITHGGTYSGNWQSLDPNVPAVTIQTSDPVVIKKSRVRGSGNLIQAFNSNVNLTVSNTYGYGLNPNVAGKAAGRFLAVYQPTNISVTNCYVESIGGIYLDGHGWTPQTVTIRYNRAHNIDGRASDGNGGHSTDFVWLQFLQLNNVQNVPGIDIGWNEVINEPYNSLVADNINIYGSSGTSSSPIRIHDNYIQGAYPGNPAQDSYAGGGILLGDGDSSTVSDAPHFVRAYNNQVVNTSNYGIAIAAGHDNQFYNNRIISSGILPDGTPIASQNVGSYIWDEYSNIAKGTFYNNWAHDNTVGWVGKNGAGRSDFWYPDCTTGKCVNNTSLSDSITLNTEKSEYQIWLNKLSSKHVTIGPNF